MTPTYIYDGEERYYAHEKVGWPGADDGIQPNAGILKSLDSFFIYCDLAAEQYTGDTFSNLLRMCPVRKGIDNQRIVQSFDKIHYVTIAKRYFQAIDIQIKTIDDQFVKFKDITYVKLHFRAKA